MPKPQAELVRFSCPSCGAELPPTPLTEPQRCDYCGSRFAPQGARGAKTAAGEVLDQAQLVAHLRRVEARAAEAEARAREAKAEAKQAEREVSKQAKRAKRAEGRGCLGRLISGLFSLLAVIVTIVGVLAALIIGGLFSLFDVPLLGELDITQQLAEELASEAIDPWAGPPMLTTIAGEPALVVRVRDQEHQRIYVDAYAIPSAERRWRIGPLSRDERELDQVRFTIAGPWVVVSEVNARAHVHILETGARVRSVDLREDVDYLCTVASASAEGEVASAPAVYVRGVRRRHGLLDPETGELERYSKTPVGCEPARADDLDASVVELAQLRGRVDGVELLRAHASAQLGLGLALGLERGEASAEAEETPPTLVALALSFDAEDGDARARRLAKGRALSVKLGEPRARLALASGANLGPSTLVGARAYVGWIDAEGRTMVGAIDLDGGDLEGGTLAWSQVVEPEVGERLVSLRASAEHLLVARTHVLELRDASTGELLATIGEVPGS